MRDLDWTGGKPGNGKPMEAINKQQNMNILEPKITRKFSLKNRLFSIFQHKTPNIESKPSLTYEKSKLLKDVDNKPPGPETGPRIPHLEFKNYQKQNLRHIKSLPPHQVHVHLYKPACLVSVSTQTDPYSPGHGQDNSIRTRHWLQGRTPLYRPETRREEMTRSSHDTDDLILYKQRADIHFHSTSDVVCPTTDIDTVDDDTTDSDDTSDDESINIYEEALNCEDDTYYEYTRHPDFTNPWPPPPSFHQSYFASPPSHAVVEKKKLSRTSRSNPPPWHNLGQPQCVNQHPSEKEDSSRSKVQILKKSISSKLSFFHSKKAYNF